MGPRDEQSGKRKYFVDDLSGEMVDERINAIRCFIHNVRRRFSKVHDHTQPLCPLFVEIGYRNNSERRLKQRSSHICSNTIMNLFEAVCKSFFFGDEFRICQFVVYLLWEADQADVAEIVFTLLNNVTIRCDSGFLTCDPSNSAKPMYDIPKQHGNVFSML